MQNIILADDHALFRAGAAMVLAMEDDLRIIAQCPDCTRLYSALNSCRNAIVIVASSMRPDLVQVFAKVRAGGSLLILVGENWEAPPAMVLSEVNGLVYRNISKEALLETVRHVIRGEHLIHPLAIDKGPAPVDLVGARVRDRLTPKEMKIVALIMEGCKNREIGSRLNTSEQVVKNYLRSIFDKTGVSGRLELALFTMHHRTLADAADKAGSLLESGTSIARQGSQ